MTDTPTVPTAEPGSHGRAATVAGEYRRTSLPQSSPLQVGEEITSVESATKARLRTTAPHADTRNWGETDPWVYQAVNVHDVLWFEVTDAAVDRMDMTNEPTGVYQPVPVHDRQLVTLGFLPI